MDIDETTDTTGRCMAMSSLGLLSIGEPGKRFLIATEEMTQTNHSTIAGLFTESIESLGDTFDSDNILLFLTGSVPYMVKAGDALRVLYPNIIHVTCLAHGMHRVAETVRLFPFP